MAFKTFTVGEVAAASDVNTYLMKQAVIVCTSGTRPSSPVEGMTIFETDTDKLLIFETSWRHGFKVGASESYSPAWTSTGTAPALGNGTLTGRYHRVGNMVALSIRLVMGSTTTFGTGAYSFSLPFTAATVANHAWVGTCYYRDVSAGGSGHFEGGCVVDSAATTLFLINNASQVTNASPFTWVSTDSATASIVYEAA